jgi:hypothetical protein
MQGRKNCADNGTQWICDVLPTPCFKGRGVPVCATDEASARTAAAGAANQLLKPNDPGSIVIGKCTDTGIRLEPPPLPASIVPHITPQGGMCDGSGGASGAGGGAPACGGAGDACVESLECCAGLVCSLNSCD